MQVLALENSTPVMKKSEFATYRDNSYSHFPKNISVWMYMYVYVWYHSIQIYFM